MTVLNGKMEEDHTNNPFHHFLGFITCNICSYLE